MSVKKTISQFVQTFFILQRNTQELSDKIDVNSWHFHNIFDIFQSQHQQVRVSGGSNKNLFAIKLFQFCDLKTQQRYILQEEVNISKREPISLVDSLRDFLRTFDNDSKCVLIPVLKPKVEIGSTKWKANLFALY